MEYTRIRLHGVSSAFNKSACLAPVESWSDDEDYFSAHVPFRHAIELFDGSCLTQVQVESSSRVVLNNLSKRYRLQRNPSSSKVIHEYEESLPADVLQDASRLVEQGLQEFAMSSHGISSRFICLTAALSNCCKMPSMKESPNQATGFFLNLHSLINIHALHSFNAPNSTLQRAQFSGRACYRVGGRVYSLLEIEQEVLQCPPVRSVHSPPSGNFGARSRIIDVKHAQKDNSITHANRTRRPSSADWRLPYAICFMTMSSPNSTIFHGFDIDQHLEVCVQQYVSKHVTWIGSINEDCTLILSIGEQFTWTTESREGLLKMIARYHDNRVFASLILDHLNARKAIDMIVTPYDWSIEDMSAVKGQLLQRQHISSWRF